MSDYNPTTPTDDQSRGPALWTSPHFSDYFSDSSPRPSADARKVRHPVQTQIIFRLDAVSRKIASQDFDGSQSFNLVEFAAELSALEASLNAPDPQSREIAEEETSGLFADEDDPAVLQEENEGLRRRVQESEDVVERVSKLSESLRHRYEDMQKLHEAASEQLEQSTDEIAELKDEVSALRHQNTQIHSDLRSALPTIFRLKSHLDAIERQATAHVDQATLDKLQANIARFRREWKDVSGDFEAIGKRYKPPSRSGSEMGDGMSMSSSSFRGDEAIPPESAKGHRSIIIMRRGGLIRRLNVERGDKEHEEVDSAIDDADSYQAGNSDAEMPAADGGASDGEMPAAGDGDSDVASGDQQTVAQMEQASLPASTNVQEEKQVTPASPSQTPWAEFWDSLADFVGIRDYDDYA